MIQKSESGLVDFSDTEISLAAAFPGFCCPDTVIESSAPETMHSCWLVSQCCCQCCGTWWVSCWTSSVGSVVGTAVAAEVVAPVSPVDGFRSGFG
ncbi:hypothetical protein Nepgr_031763 [Nepenthes gracilis]|uniref:Uncharacterized protein n=1 Tax=Nepenthes gracilis TaxID=150966 RepID=A0AAD3THY9_NEPGR|nr:hypothetical protein Nepgr_031763 [Nepenthes gracilis]